MPENPGALEKLYSMLHDAESLGLSRPARMRLIGIIGSLESEELDRFRDTYVASREREGERERPARGDEGRRPQDEGERGYGSRYRERERA